MERLSQSTLFMKRVFPVLWCVIVALILIPALASGRATDAWPMVLMPVLILAIGLLVFRKLVWGLADAVDLSADTLIVRRGSIEERVPLQDVVNVSISQFTNPKRVSLRLRSPGAFGDEIAFIPKAPYFQFNPFARNPVAEKLIARVDALRRQDGR